MEGWLGRVGLVAQSTQTNAVYFLVHLVCVFWFRVYMVSILFKFGSLIFPTELRIQFGCHSTMMSD